ncbi:MAG: hypothetical protein QNJ19_03255 [Woeseiaceae bacterium]|nr:hypothetical protein [Woeseiaceae bacterium]
MSETRVLMIASSLAMAVAGVIASFLPQETLAWMGAAVTPGPVTAIQIAGALYLGLAAMNWMARGVLIGGIYARPLSFGNFVHFMIGAITLAKLTVANPDPVLIAIALPYVLFAAWFGRVVFRPPVA